MHRLKVFCASHTALLHGGWLGIDRVVGSDCLYLHHLSSLAFIISAGLFFFTFTYNIIIVVVVVDAAANNNNNIITTTIIMIHWFCLDPQPMHFLTLTFSVLSPMLTE